MTNNIIILSFVFFLACSIICYKKYKKSMIFPYGKINTNDPLNGFGIFLFLGSISISICFILVSGKLIFETSINSIFNQPGHLEQFSYIIELINKVLELTNRISIYLLLILLILLLSIILIVILAIKNKKSSYKYIAILCLAGSTFVLFEKLLNVEEFKLFEFHKIDKQIFNNYENEKIINKNDKIKKIILLDTIKDFKSGSFELPHYNWNSLRQKFKNVVEKNNIVFVLVSGYSDPQVVKSDSKISNIEIAKSRAIAVKNKLKDAILSYYYDDSIPIFTIHNGLEEGVKLFNYQIKKYSDERKVCIYLGINDKKLNIKSLELHHK